ncbi:GFA family protein [Methylovirgula sp. 4M-Z18]|uniref:GFA family protein n=1 Tax=Methylovirgula sp. 4M-Z18 TaxID=2293567 RepID=UPI000E2F72C5|nr:GFA family protein [Methylovirgula sp. 4M-Z18]RFB79311.1 GFA family protein [Methylovirgula sp. 4M-Z18]
MTTTEPATPGRTGGCQCGAIRYRLDAAPNGAVICHCRMCQKASGGPFTAFCGVPTPDFVVTRGALSIFRSSEIAERGFCATCGTPLTYRLLAGKRVGVSIGSLDDPNTVVPEEQLGAESRVVWLAAALAAPEASLSEWLKSRQITSVGSRQHPDHQTHA